MKNARGTDDARISRSAGAAARAKKASEAAAHIEVASVLNPMGLRINVAGNSFITSKNTSAAPDKIPGAINGNVTDEKTPMGLRPNPLATSSIRGLT